VERDPSSGQEPWAKSLARSTRVVAAVVLILIVAVIIGVLLTQFPDLSLWFRLLTASAVFGPLVVFSLAWVVEPERTSIRRSLVLVVACASAAIVAATFALESMAR